ncbi:NADP-dependent oxidoreductase [Streptomyces resistomycificus]|uniref:NADP-dependent oxidoreductase n=1 Tax=Streptomyces resistomycificus TaxID=67356 RepID=A0A0L8L5K2_9ACTN|nr:NADP-dependent oxidoreductase [Streptomyces resistomycificus]KOG33379.1 NADP-dependent oxidoreductase [Streptomyces resistomycificus]KUN99589.1 NADP-dependent oxidoreductase [Streptomyces resistomycificus]
MINREWHLLSRPVGWPKPEDFALVEAEIRQPREGQVLVRNKYLSVDPYMRGRMSDAKSYVAPFELGKAMQGGAVGEVVASEAEGIAVGDHVLHFGGWREYATFDAQQAVKVDPEAAPLSAYLGVLGMTGLTAYAGLLRTGAFKEGDSVFVSGAAGAVGSQVGQIAKLKGASRVIGSAGSDEKVKLLVEEYGFDAAFNYKSGSVAGQLREAAPDGVDVYFDNVGGDHLEAALGQLNQDGRIAVCGMISVYNNTEPVPGPKNLARLIATRGRIQGFLVSDHYDLQPQFVQEVGPWVASGALKYRETVVEGIENNLEAFLGVLRGDNTGKMIVKL